MKRSNFSGLALLLIVALAACTEAPPTDPAQALREALVAAEPGSTITIPEGHFTFDRSLSLGVNGVTLKGAGHEKSILDFAGQLAGAEGLLVAAEDVTLEGFAVLDAKGDAIKMNQCKNLVVPGVRTEWTGGPKSTNGAYGLYPVQCEGVLIEDSVAIGASDAGIYVGQSKNIIVRRNEVAFNVAGIEIENSTQADVYENNVVDNTGGILVFDLPDLPVQGGRQTRVFRNRLAHNNTANFAPEGNIVGTVPAGSGIMVNSNDDIEIFENEIIDHQTAAVLVVSYLITGRPLDDPNYDPFPEKISVHHNTIENTGYAPDSEPLLALKTGANLPALPAIIWDGFQAPGQAGPVVCAHDNGELGAVALDAPNGFDAPDFSGAPFACERPALPPVVLSGAE
jgi:parallel beta-helix repeat protein